MTKQNLLMFLIALVLLIAAVVASAETATARYRLPLDTDKPAVCDSREFCDTPGS